MAGDIKIKYPQTTANLLTVTNLHSLASSSTFTSGWGSAWIDNTSDLALDRMVGGDFFLGTSPTAGEIRCYAIPSYDNGTHNPGIIASGTLGTEGALSITDTEQLDGSCVLIWSTATDTTTNDPHAMTARGIAAYFNSVPQKFALYVTHNTVAALKSSGNVVYDQPITNQYT